MSNTKLLKQFVVLLLVLSTIPQLVFCLSCVGIYIKTTSLQLHHLWSVFFLQWHIASAVRACKMECVYPFGEGIAGSILMTMGNVVLLFFYVAFILPHSDVRWMNWVTYVVISYKNLNYTLFIQ